MWALLVTDEFARSYRKLCGRNKTFKEAVDKKVVQIRTDPMRFKPLRKPLQGYRRVHVQGSFVLVYQVHKKAKVVRLQRLAHHEEAYGF